MDTDRSARRRRGISSHFGYQTKEVSSVMDKFRQKSGASDVAKYYSNFDVNLSESGVKNRDTQTLTRTRQLNFESSQTIDDGRNFLIFFRVG
jgi:hypothetical protein